MRTQLRKSFGVALALVVGGAFLPGAAAAPSDAPPEPANDLASLSQQIDATTENPEARAAFQEILQTRIAEGATGGGLSVYDYVPDNAGTGTATALAYPSNCSFSVLLTFSPGRSTLDELASCSTTKWNKNELKATITGYSPVNPLIWKTLKDNSKVSWGPASYTTNTIYYICKNTNKTLIYGTGSSTMTVGTSTYTASGFDSYTVNCGW